MYIIITLDNDNATNRAIFLFYISFNMSIVMAIFKIYIKD